MTTHAIERRAAFDIGSGSIKVVVADVNPSLGKIEKILWVDKVSVKFREHLAKSPDQRIDDHFQAIASQALLELKEKASHYQPQAYSAIATEALRLAENGPAVMLKISEETGIPISIISQEEEGILGFLTAAELANLDADQVVSLDIGAGSFQVTAKHGDQFLVYSGRSGIVPMKQYLLDLQNRDSKSPNPVSKIEAAHAASFIRRAMPAVPQKLSEKIAQANRVIGIGMNPLWTAQEDLNYSRSDIERALRTRLDKDDEELSSLPTFGNRQTTSIYSVSNLILTGAIMNVLNINQVQYVGASPAGSAIGVLLSPTYWN